MAKKLLKRKRKEDGNDDLQAKLSAYGESFMQLFEPTEFDARNTNHTNTSDSEYLENGLSDGTSDGDSSEDDGDALDAGNHAPIEHIFSTANADAGSNPPKGSVAARNVPSRIPADRAKLERQRFMSHKAGVVSGAIPLPQTRRKAEKEGETNGLTKEEFQKLKREVHLYGAAALDKKSKKKFEAAMLEELGAKKEKGMKIPAKIGLGMAKKRAQREAIALEESIAAGMVKVKGMGKKKRAEKKAGLDRGLMEDMGAFKGGVLKVGKLSNGGRTTGGKKSSGGSARFKSKGSRK